MADTKRPMKTTKPPKSGGLADADSRQPPSGRWWIALAVLLLIGLVQQVLILSEGWRENPLTTTPVQDAEIYWNWAGEIASGQLLGTTPFMSAPLYPYLLGAVRALGGGLPAVYTLQAFLHLVTLALLTYLAARRFGSAVGLLAGALFILLTEPAFFAGRVLNCTLQLFLIVALWLALLRAQERRTLAGWITAGALTGLNCLANPPMLLAILLLALWAWWQGGFSRRGLAHAGILIGSAAIVISPATWHNYKVCGELIPVSAQAGVTFAQGNGPGAEGTYKQIAGVSGSRYMQNLDALRFYRETTGNPGSWIETSRFFFRNGLAFWRKHPGIAVKLLQFKVYWFVTGRVYGDIYFPTFEIDQGFADSLRLAPLPLAWLIPPALIALLILLRSSLRRYIPELVLIIVPLLVVALFFYSPRYRFPATPVLVAVAAGAFYRALHWRKDQVGALITGGALAIGVYFGHANRSSGFDSLASYDSYCYNSVAVAYSKTDNVDAAIRYFEKALQADPENTTARANLGSLLATRGDRRASLEQLRRALEDNPQSAVAHDQLARALAQAGQLDQALAYFRQAVQLNPDDPEIRHNLAKALMVKKQYDEAVEHCRAALRVNPAFTQAHLNLGRLLLQKGELDAALHHLSETLRFDPKVTEAHLLMARIHLERRDARHAIAALRSAYQLAPENHQLARDLAWLLATTPGLAQSDRSEAVRLARQAVAMNARKSPALLDTLAAALAASGQFEEAIRTCRRAIELAEHNGDLRAARQYRERLRLYEASQPYTEPLESIAP